MIIFHDVLEVEGNRKSYSSADFTNIYEISKDSNKFNLLQHSSNGFLNILKNKLDPVVKPRDDRHKVHEDDSYNVHDDDRHKVHEDDKHKEHDDDRHKGHEDDRHKGHDDDSYNILNGYRYNVDENDINIDGKNLIALPALIDPHVHFRTPGFEYKEDWQTGSIAAIAGGITTVCDMPNTNPACITSKNFFDKNNLIQQQLKNANSPIRYHLYLGASKNHLNEIESLAKSIIGIKLFLGSSTGNLLLDDIKDIEKVFSIAAKHDLLIAVHAEDENIIKANKIKYKNANHPSFHNKIRNKEAAISALKICLKLAKKYNVRIYILHISTKEELDLIRKAKDDGISVFAEVTPHHLFLSEKHITQLGTKIVVNPPLRSENDQDYLFNAIADGTIDIVGSDHAPHLIEEKLKPYPQTPAGVPGIETTLPLLYTAYTKGKISLQNIINLTSRNAIKMLRLEPNEDLVLIDQTFEKTLTNNMLHTKCKWSPYEQQTLKGWPSYVICKNKLYVLKNVLEDLR